MDDKVARRQVAEALGLAHGYASHAFRLAEALRAGVTDTGCEHCLEALTSWDTFISTRPLLEEST